MDGFCGSTFWNRSLTWDTDNPALTECSEQTIVAWLPCIFFWLTTPFEIYYMTKSREKDVPWGVLNISKIASVIVLIAICIADFVYSAATLEQIYPVHYVTPLIRIVTYTLSGLLVHYIRKHGMRTSGVQFIFYLLSVISAISPLRSVISSTQYDYIFYWTVLHFTMLVLSFLLACFVDFPPKITPFVNEKNTNPERAASFPTRLTFTWFDPMAMIGFRRDITEADLWALNPEDTSAEVCQRFGKHWNRANDKRKRKYEQQNNAKFTKSTGSVHLTSETHAKPISVFPALCKAFGAQFLFGSFLRLCYDLLSFCPPQLLSLLIAFVEGDEPMWHGYVYASLFILVSTLGSLCLSHYFVRMSLVGMKTRTALTAALYRKALLLSPAAKRGRSVGEIVNLMAIDAHRFIELMNFVNMAWSDVLQVILALYFLWAQLGVATLAGLGVMVLLFPMNGVIASRSKKLQLKQLKYKDQRAKMMTELLNGIKVLKMYAWEEAFGEEINKIRQKEVKILKQNAYLMAAVSFIMTSTPFLVSFVSFGCYVLMDERNVLDGQRAFVSLALFNMLRMPLSMLPMVISSIVQAMVAIKRINRFLNSEELDPKAVEKVDKSDKSMGDATLIIENGFFSWNGASNPDETFQLRSINIRVTQGSLVGIVGTVGNGKSSLLAAALGEMIGTGRVRLRGTVASVPQQPWIRNATVRENVIFGTSEFESTRYQDVLERCSLGTDIAMLPDADLTEIGEKGVNLSGGQKARVALARALYAQRDVYFLDDPLSAVDAHVGRHLFEYAIGPNSSLAKTTRLWVTHSVTYLPRVDYILVLKEGRIAEQGGFQELLDKKGEFADFLLAHLADDTPDSADTEVLEMRKELENKLGDEYQTKLQRMRSVSSSSSDKKIPLEGDETRSAFNRQSSVPKVVKTSFSRQNSELNGGTHEMIKRQNSELKSQLSQTNKKEESHPLIGAEKTETGSVKWSVYKYYAKNVGFAASIGTLFMNVAMQALSSGANFWLARWSSDNTTVVDGVVDPSKRDMYLGVYGALGVGQIICVTISSLLLFVFCLRAARVLHTLLLARILRAPTTTFFDVTPVGRILNRFSKDIDTVDSALPMTLRQYTSCLTSVLGAFVVISISSPLFLVLIIPLGITYYIIQRFYIGISRQLKRLESVTRSPIYSHFSESIAGASSIRAYQATDRFILESHDKVDRNQVCYYPSFVANRWLAIRLEFLGNSVTFFTALFAVLNKGSPTSHLVGLATTYALQITASLNWMVRMSSEVETNIVAVERIKEYSEVPQEAEWDDSADVSVDSKWPEHGAVELQGLTVAYRPNMPAVLHDLTCSIRGGEKIGVVGRTGAGKSTLTLALFRIVEPISGQMRVDNVDTTTLGLRRLRSRVTVIPQDPILFSGSLRLNLDPFNSHSDADLWHALELAGLKSMVEAFPAGLKHEVAESGDNLSLGQRQLVCLARALLRRSRLLVLDEATAAVDLDTDAAIQKTIRSEFRDATVLTIAHRLDTVMDADRIMVLDKGRLVEFDSPAALVADRRSLFFSMAREAGIVR